MTVAMLALAPPGSAGDHRARTVLGPLETHAPSRGHTSPPPRGGLDAPSWRRELTPSFRVLHLGHPLASRVARTAETLRTRLLASWGGEGASARPWRPRADLYLYSSYGELVTMTGGDPKLGSAVVRPSRLSPGRILSRRVNLTADDRDLFDGTMPHEITHLVLGELLGGRVPLWANEGAATVAEGAAKLRSYRRLLRRRQATGALYRLRDLLGMGEYPAAAHKLLFYAQSACLAQLLVEQGTPDRFVRFVRVAVARDYDWALRSVYSIDGVAELERRFSRALSSPRPSARRGLGAR